MSDIEASLETSVGTPSIAELEVAAGRFTAAASDAGLIDIAYERHDSPFGRILTCATEVGIVQIGLPTDDEAALLEALAARISPRILRATRPTLTAARQELDEYFDGRRQRFAVPLDWRMARGFRAEVLHALTAVPYGQTVTYADLAARAGRPTAVRAAGSAMATNPIPIIVPCHRVLRTGGAIGSYRGGVEMKARLIELENGHRTNS